MQYILGSTGSTVSGSTCLAAGEGGGAGGGGEREGGRLLLPYSGRLRARAGAGAGGHVAVLAAAGVAVRRCSCAHAVQCSSASGRTGQGIGMWWMTSVVFTGSFIATRTQASKQGVGALACCHGMWVVGCKRQEEEGACTHSCVAPWSWGNL
mmetsp:Transcript_14772/g.36859  ORF Transcript_14772/g.36859 Transcript_14772/m.36859 type:complete len:152 (+) Transcript_14772:3742-4197(+)